MQVREVCEAARGRVGCSPSAVVMGSLQDCSELVAWVGGKKEMAKVESRPVVGPLDQKTF